jgi:hypothetical protein
MFCSKFSAVAAAAALSLIASSVAEVVEGSITPETYVPGGKSNLALYWVSSWKEFCTGRVANSMDRERVPVKRNCWPTAMSRLLISFLSDS